MLLGSTRTTSVPTPISRDECLWTACPSGFPGPISTRVVKPFGRRAHYTLPSYPPPRSVLTHPPSTPPRCQGHVQPHPTDKLVDQFPLSRFRNPYTCQSGCLTTPSKASSWLDVVTPRPWHYGTSGNALPTPPPPLPLPLPLPPPNPTQSRVPYPHGS
jgi:hypothetical protein